LRKPSVWALVAVAVALVLALAGLVYVELGPSRSTDVAGAVAAAPAGSQRLSWTDWAGVRREVGSSVGEDADQAGLIAFLDDAFEADLSSRSALLESAGRLHQLYGWSPASVDWELFSQGAEGAVITVHLPDDTDFADLARRLESMGYPRPSSDDGVWAGGPDLVTQLDAALTPELANVVLDADDHLVLASDQEAYVETALAAANGEGEGPVGLGDVTDALGEPLSAAIYSGDYACGALAMAQADADDQALAAELVAAAGAVDPYRAFAMGTSAGGGVRVVMEFTDDDQARTNADSRAALASGPAVGQGGDFADRFRVESAGADGRLVTLDLDPVDGQYVLSDLSSGPLLFATC
jgi:hypothetical protein